METLHVSALMMSRLCHDLAASLTSLAYGKELLEDDSAPDMRASGRDLLDRGIVAATTKLAFFRYAYGSPGLQKGDADMAEAIRLITEYCTLTHVKIHCDLSEKSLSFAKTQLLMNMAMIMDECLPRGGDIHIEINDDAKGIVSLRGSGSKLVIASHIAPAIVGDCPQDGWEARTIHTHFTYLLAKNLGLSIRLEQQDDAMLLVTEG